MPTLMTHHLAAVAVVAAPVDRIQRRYLLDEIRYSPSVRQRMPSIDLNTINFESGSWEIPQDQAQRLCRRRVLFVITMHVGMRVDEVNELSECLRGLFFCGVIVADL